MNITNFLIICGAISIFLVPFLFVVLLAAVSMASKRNRNLTAWSRNTRDYDWIYDRNYETAAERKSREKLDEIETMQRQLWYKEFFKQ
jgi:hypothetical protein